MLSLCQTTDTETANSEIWLQGYLYWQEHHGAFMYTNPEIYSSCMIEDMIEELTELTLLLCNYSTLGIWDANIFAVSH